MGRIVRWVAVPVAAVVVAAAGAGCGDGGDTGGDDPGVAAGGAGLSVVANFYPVAEAARQVGGDRVDVTDLTPAGVEPHDLELAPDQVDELEDADVVLYLGDGFQPAVSEIAERRGDAAVDLMDGIELEAGEGAEGNAADPHFWLDPTLMSDAVAEIEAALANASPDDADAFAANAARYQDELASLDRDMQTGLADCDRDEIVTSHAAFHYLARRYGLTQLPIAGLSPEAEPDADRLAELTDRIEADGITTVFYETLVAPEVAETLAREAHVATAVLNPLEGLSEDEIDAGDDYLTVMRANLAQLSEALGCR